MTRDKRAYFYTKANNTYYITVTYPLTTLEYFIFPRNRLPKYSPIGS